MFSDHILTPSAFTKDLGSKQIRFKGFMELCYLRPKYFKPNPKVLESLGLKEGEPFVIVRFVSWNANHDVGEKGLNIKDKKDVVGIGVRLIPTTST